MIHILRDDDRLGVLREGQYRGLKGPGIVVHLSLSETYVRLRIGDIGDLTTADSARFGDAIVPVTGDLTASRVRIIGFDSELAPARPRVAPAGLSMQDTEKAEIEHAGPRKKAIPLTGFWKYFFAVTVFPLFIAGMILNMWLLQEFLPGLFDFLARMSQELPLGRRRRVAPFAGFILAVPLAVVLSVIWYKVVLTISRAGAAMTKSSRRDQNSE